MTNTCWADTPEFELVSGRPAEYHAWLAKLPAWNPEWDRDRQRLWLDSLDALREAFPRLQKATVPLSAQPFRQCVIAWPADITSEEIAFLREVLAFYEEAWKRPA